MTGMETHTQDEHSKLSPSKSYRWLACPASIMMIEKYEKKEGIVDVAGEAAQWGTVAHYMAKGCLLYNKDAMSWASPAFRMPRYPIPEIKIPVDRAMVACVQDYIDYCNGLKLQYAGSKVMVEERIKIDESTEVHVFGTGDFVIYHARSRTIIIVDLKTGQQESIPADSSQNRMYGVGVLRMFPKAISIHLVIVQPRDKYGDVIKTRVMPRRQLERWRDNVMVPGIIATQSANPPFGPGETQCKYCPVAHKCGALTRYISRMTKRDFNTMNVHEQVVAYRSFGLIRVWMDRITDYLDNELKNGRRIMGLKLVQGRSSRYWLDDDEKVIKALLRIGLTRDDIVKQSLITPPAAEKLLTRTEHVLLEPMIGKSIGGLVMTTDDDKRHEATYDPKKDFDD